MVQVFLVLLMSYGTRAVELNRVRDWLIRMMTAYVAAYVQPGGNRRETCEFVWMILHGIEPSLFPCSLCAPFSLPL